MHTNRLEWAVCGLVLLGLSATASGQSSSTHDPTWWDKFQLMSTDGPDLSAGATSSAAVGKNVDVSNECGPQSETFITLDPNRPNVLAAGSNEIFRLPMRGYFSTDGGATWGGVDLPLPPPRGASGSVFASDPTVAFDTLGNVFYGYIVVHFSPNRGLGLGFKGTGVAVARSSDGGRTYPFANFFSFEGGENHFNDKPMITADTSPSSPFRDNVYIAWDAASGGSPGGGIRVAASSDHGATFTITRADNPFGPGRSIGTSPFVGPNGELFVAWNDFAANAIVFNRSFDAGATWGTPTTIASKTIPFDIAIPAEFVRRALVYPSCGADRSSGAHRGRLYCSWLDLGADGGSNIFLSFSDDQGQSWTSPAPVPDAFPFVVDRFNHWMSVDPVTGDVNVAFYDTRNDTTGMRFMTDYYFAQSRDGGLTFLSPNTRVSTVSSNEHDCNGLFPCPAINYGNQQGDYEGLVSFGGVSHPIWTDSRRQLEPATGCRRPFLMEEVFTATVK